MSSAQPRSTLAASAYSRLREDIMNGDLQPGQKLPVADLRDHYSIGLSPIREALNRLCADGIVTKKEQRGFFVTEVSESDLLEVTNTRILIEEVALRQAFCRRTSEWEERMLVAFHRLSKLSQEMEDENYILNKDWGRLHYRFHAAILSACGSPWLLSFCSQLYDQSRRYRRLVRSKFVKGNLNPRPVIGEHRVILDACLEDDIEKATTLLTEHYRRSAEILLDCRLDLLENPRRLVHNSPALTNEAQPAASPRG